MSEVAALADRGVVSVTGPDAEKLIGGLVTNEIALLDEAPALFAGLLTPQGKILFDFLVVRGGGGLLLETAREKAAELAKRLTMYKLRAAVEIKDVLDAYRVAVAWGDAFAFSGGTGNAISFADPRHPDLGLRVLATANFAEEVFAAIGGSTSTPERYHAHRVALGIPEGGKDYVLGDAYPHEALYDQIGGVSFTKGCFVGQEVVSRMQHRGNVKKRIVQVAGASDLPSGQPPVLAGGVEIGRLGSVAGTRGLALLRIDRVAEALRDGMPVTAGGITLDVRAPAFAKFSIEVPRESV
jgi:hypothetical protein